MQKFLVKTDFSDILGSTIPKGTVIYDLTCTYMTDNTKISTKSGLTVEAEKPGYRLLSFKVEGQGAFVTPFIIDPFTNYEDYLIKLDTGGEVLYGSKDQ